MRQVAQPPREIAGPLMIYAYERSLGVPPEEACRRAGGKVEKGDATKWERNPGVQSWISYLDSLGFTAEAAAAAAASQGVGFGLAGDIIAALGLQPAKEQADSRWKIPRWPVFYSSWTFWSTASFSTVPWPSTSRWKA
jgi:hypothetical protein